MVLTKKGFREQKAKIKKSFKKIKHLKIKFINLYLLIVALLSIAIFILFELFLRMYNLYLDYPWLDVPSHFIAGFAVASLTIWILHFSKGKYKIGQIMVSVFVVSIFWEILETLQELVIPNPPHLVDIFFWDGFWDVIMTLIGGYIFIKIFDKVLKMRIMRHVKNEFQ